MAIKLTEGPVSQRMFEMAMPMVWALLAMMSFNAVDTFFVAQLGDSQLAAMSFTFPVEMLFSSVAIGAGAGVSSSLARLLGAGDITSARRVFTDAMILVGVISIVFALAGYQLIEPVFTLLGAEQDLMPYIREYMETWYWCVPALIVSQVFMTTLRAMGLAKLQGSIMTGLCVLNVILDPLLIFGLAGFPRLELQGAALATVLVRVFGLFLVYYILCEKHKMIAPFIAPWPQVRKSWGAVLHVGLPAMATNMIIPVASGIVVLLVSQYGNEAVAGLGVAARIEPLALVCFYALSSIMGPLFGQNYGARLESRLIDAHNAMTRFCLAWGLLLAGALFFAGRLIASAFSDSAEVQQVAATYLAIVPLSYGAYGIVMSACAAFNGLGMPFPALVISSCRVLILYLPMALLAQHFWGINGLFVATALANLLLGFVSHRWLRQRIRKEFSELNSQASTR